MELTEEIAPKWEFIRGKTFEFPVSGRTENRNEKQKDSQLLRKDTISHRTRAVWRLYSGTLFQRGTQTGRIHAAAGTGQDFNFSGLELLLKRYVIRTGEHIALETPQEMYLGIALHLAMKEKGKPKKGRGAWNGCGNFTIC